MTEQSHFSRAQLCAISRAPEDAVVFWIRQGLLVSATDGPRKHRRFDRDEVKIAALLGEARSIGMNVGAMVQLVSNLREAIELHRNVPDRPRTAPSAGDSRTQALQRYVAMNFAGNEGLLVALSGGDGAIQLDTAVAEDRLPARSAIVFDLSRILDLDWPV